MDIDRLKKLLLQPELQVYTVVVMAQRDLAKDNLRSAMNRLRVDADKFHDQPELYQMILDYFTK